MNDAIERTAMFQPTALTIDDEKLRAAQYEAWMRVRLFAVRAHQICNLLRVAHPEIGELADDGCLHEAIHDLMRVDWPIDSPGSETVRLPPRYCDLGQFRQAVEVWRSVQEVRGGPTDECERLLALIDSQQGLAADADVNGERHAS